MFTYIQTYILRTGVLLGPMLAAVPSAPVMNKYLSLLYVYTNMNTYIYIYIYAHTYVYACYI